MSQCLKAAIFEFESLRAVSMYLIQKITEIYNKITEMYKKITELEISS